MDYVEVSEDNCWILEDNIRSGHRKIGNLPTSDFSIKGITAAFVFGKELFQYFLKEELLMHNIVKALRLGGAYPFIGFLARISSQIRQRIMADSLTSGDLKQIAAGVDIMIIGAFDEEGYIIIELS